MRNPVRCVKCNKVFCDQISGNVRTTLSTEYIDGGWSQAIVMCGRCKTKFSVCTRRGDILGEETDQRGI